MLFFYYSAQIGFSSEPGQGAIVPFKEYDRKFSPHLVNKPLQNMCYLMDVYYYFTFFLQLDWISFAVMSMPSLALPFALCFSSKSKYELIMKQKKDLKQG